MALSLRTCNPWLRHPNFGVGKGAKWRLKCGVAVARNPCRNAPMPPARVRGHLGICARALSSPRLTVGINPTTLTLSARIKPVSARTHPCLGRRSTSLPVLASTTQTRSHAGHSHHHHDATYLTSKDRKDPGVRITRIGLFTNVAMAVVKGFGGYVFNSQALVADAFHALTDLVSDVMTLATLSWSLKPPTSRFPSGYGKIECLGSLGVSGLLLGGGVLMAMNACNTLYAQFFLDAAEHALQAHGHGHGHSHAAADLIPDIKAAWLAAGTIIVKEWLYRATMKVARKQKSSVLASNAVHHRVDSLTGLVAFIAVGGAHVLNGATWLDPVGGLIVSAMVIKAGWSNTAAALFELADATVEQEVSSAVRVAATKALQTVEKEHAGGADVALGDIQGIKSGQNYMMDIALAVPDDWPLDKAHAVERAVREQVGGAVRGVRRVKVRFVPRDTQQGDFADEFIDPDITRKSSPTPSETSDHEHHHHHEERIDRKKD